MDIENLPLVDPRSVQQDIARKADELAFYNIVYAQVINGLELYDGHEITQHLAVHLNNTAFFKKCKIDYSDNLFYNLTITDLNGRSFPFLLGFRNSPIFSVRRFKELCNNYRRIHFYEQQVDDQEIVESCQAWNDAINTLKEVYAKFSRLELSDSFSK